MMQAEDLNTLIGNAFRVAYAVQLQEEKIQDATMGRPTLRTLKQSRSVDSILSEDQSATATATTGEEDEPLYELADFPSSRRSQEDAITTPTSENGHAVMTTFMRVNFAIIE